MGIKIAILEPREIPFPCPRRHLQVDPKGVRPTRSGEGYHHGTAELSLGCVGFGKETIGSEACYIVSYRECRSHGFIENT